MIRHLVFASTLAAVALAVSAVEGDWAFRASYYTHDPATGQRVTQYSPGATPYARIEPNYQQSAYRQQHIRIGGGRGGADNIHIVESWGNGENVRPYGEWQYPYRAGATPYGPWGNPQGPWTLPFESWVNPYGLGQLPFPPFPWGGSWPRAQPLPAQGFSGQGSPGRAFPGREASPDRAVRRRGPRRRRTAPRMGSTSRTPPEKPRWEAVPTAALRLAAVEPVAVGH